MAHEYKPPGEKEVLLLYPYSTVKPYSRSKALHALLKWLREAKEAGREYIDVRAGDLHRKVGGYPGPDHRMPLCCDVMRRLMGPEDVVLEEPPSGYGANLVIRYYLSRRDF